MNHVLSNYKIKGVNHDNVLTLCKGCGYWINDNDGEGYDGGYKPSSECSEEKGRDWMLIKEAIDNGDWSSSEHWTVISTDDGPSMPTAFIVAALF